MYLYCVRGVYYKHISGSLLFICLLFFELFFMYFNQTQLVRASLHFVLAYGRLHWPITSKSMSHASKKARNLAPLLLQA
jgi:hypothetical protein